MKKRLLVGAMSGLFVAGSMTVSSCSFDAYSNELSIWRSVQKAENDYLFKHFEIEHYTNDNWSTNDEYLMSVHRNTLVETILKTDFSQENFDISLWYVFSSPATGDHSGHLKYIFKPPFMPEYEYGYRSDYNPYSYKIFRHSKFHVKNNKLLGTFSIISKSDLHPYGDPKTLVVLRNKTIFQW